MLANRGGEAHVAFGTQAGFERLEPQKVSFGLLDGPHYRGRAGRIPTYPKAKADLGILLIRTNERCNFMQSVGGDGSKTVESAERFQLRGRCHDLGCDPASSRRAAAFICSLAGLTSSARP